MASRPSPDCADGKRIDKSPIFEYCRVVGVALAFRLRMRAVERLRDKREWIVSLLLVMTAVIVPVSCSGGGGRTAPDPTPTTTTIVDVTSASGVVRTLYVIPADRDVRSDYATAVSNAVMDLQSWYRGQLSGKTFTLSNTHLEECHLAKPADDYASDTWGRVLTDVQACAPVSAGSEDTVWILYVDVVHTCGAPGRLGAGVRGLLMLPRQDMDGLIGDRYFDDCGKEYRFPPSRYVGGLGHELGHGFGLSHPADCDDRLATCDEHALMWLGYVDYPDTYFTAEEKQLLLALPFFN